MMNIQLFFITNLLKITWFSVVADCSSLNRLVEEKWVIKKARLFSLFYSKLKISLTVSVTFDISSDDKTFPAILEFSFTQLQALYFSPMVEQSDAATLSNKKLKSVHRVPTCFLDCGLRPFNRCCSESSLAATYATEILTNKTRVNNFIPISFVHLFKGIEMVT